MTLDQKILELVKKYMGKLVQKKVLTSMEEVEANTNETNLVAAQVVAELNNKLAGFEPVCDSTGKITGYKTAGGADTVFPFNTGFKKAKVTLRYIVTLHRTVDGSKRSPLTISCIITNNNGILSISESHTYSGISGVYDTQGFGVDIEFNGASIEIVEK